MQGVDQARGTPQKETKIIMAETKKPLGRGLHLNGRRMLPAELGNSKATQFQVQGFEQLSSNIRLIDV